MEEYLNLRLNDVIKSQTADYTCLRVSDRSQNSNREGTQRDGLVPRRAVGTRKSRLPS